MINKITIKNFQSHKDSELEFHPGVNTIIGSSNSGKTAILRALNWLINNKPSGNSFASHWIINEKGKLKDEVCVCADNVYRIKSEKVNKYMIDDESLNAIGNGNVPEEVKKLFNLSETNIQHQMDAPFLLSQSAGEVARFFNRILKLDVIDIFLSTIDSMKRKSNSDIREIEKEIEITKKSISEFDWIDRAKRLIENHEVISHKLNDSIETHISIVDSITKYNELLEIQNQSIDIDKINLLINEFESIDKMLIENETEYDIIYNSIKRYKTLKEKAEKDNKQIIKLVEAESLFNEFEIIINLLNKMKDEYNSINNSINKYDDLKNNLNTIKKEAKILVDKLPEICPLCGNKIMEVK